MDLYPCKFEPIYKEKIWGGRNLQRLFGRALPAGKAIGESWELADLPEAVSVVVNGPAAGRSLNELTGELGEELLGRARPMGDGRFPLLVKLLDANDVLSLQVHPDERAAREIGPGAVLKTECWYVLESRGGFIYKGVKPGVTAGQFAQAVRDDTVGELARRIDVSAGDFCYLPAGVVHALGGGVVVAEVQTPSDTTYRLTDWGRGREIHVDLAMRCVRFELTGDEPPGAEGDRLLVTDYFTVARRTVDPDSRRGLAKRRCAVIIVLSGSVEVIHAGQPEPAVPARPGDTVLIPAGLNAAHLYSGQGCTCLEITLPENA